MGLIEFGKWLQEKRNFMRYSLIGFGTLASAWSIYATGTDDPLYWIFLVALSYGAAYVWGLSMWTFFMEPYLARRQNRNRD
jgi:hypothetical protein